MRKIFAAFAIAGALTLAACVGSLPDPGPSPSPNIGNAEAVIFEKYGVGGFGTSSGMGPGPNSLAGAFAKAFGARVKVVGYYQWTDAIASQMSAVPLSVKLIEVGYSCGSSMVPQDTGAVTRPVDLAAGIQASLYCGGGSLAKNVRYAIEVYNPSCPETAGLGCWLWPVGAGFIPGHFTVVKRYDMHPQADLDPDAWSDIVGAVRSVLNPALMARRTPMDDIAVHTVVRKSTWRH